MTLDSSNRFAIPGSWTAFAAHVLAPNLTAARINAPSLRSFILPEIYPGMVGAAVANLTGPIVWGARGPRFAPQEYAITEISRGGAGALVAQWAWWMGPDITPAAQGAMFTAVATSAVTTVIGSWVLGSLAFNQTLPAGRYQCIGLGVQGAGVTYARLVYPGLSQYRPGVVAQNTYGDLPWTDQFRAGQMGSMGEFLHNAPPSIEVLGNAAAAITATAYLDLVRVGAA